MSLASFGWLVVGKWGSTFELREGGSDHNRWSLSPWTGTCYYLLFLGGYSEHRSSKDEKSLQFWRIIVCPVQFKGTQTLDTCWWKEPGLREAEDYQWSRLRPSLNLDWISSQSRCYLKQTGGELQDCRGLICSFLQPDRFVLPPL